MILNCMKIPSLFIQSPVDGSFPILCYFVVLLWIFLYVHPAADIFSRIGTLEKLFWVLEYMHSLFLKALASFAVHTGGR